MARVPAVMAIVQAVYTPLVLLKPGR